MARSWRELFDTGSAATEASPAAEDGEPRRQGFFRRLRDNMGKTRQALGAELQASMFQSLDEEAFEHLEETLIYADVGAPTTAAIVERLEGGAPPAGPAPGRREEAPGGRAGRGARAGRGRCGPLAAAREQGRGGERDPTR